LVCSLFETLALGVSDYISSLSALACERLGSRNTLLRYQFVSICTVLYSVPNSLVSLQKLTRIKFRNR
jgi:hypothetical protein